MILEDDDGNKMSNENTAEAQILFYAVDDYDNQNSNRRLQGSHD